MPCAHLVARHLEQVSEFGRFDQTWSDMKIFCKQGEVFYSHHSALLSVVEVNEPQEVIVLVGHIHFRRLVARFCVSCSQLPIGQRNQMLADQLTDCLSRWNAVELLPGDQREGRDIMIP